ncbi:MAG: UDP-glucose 4-epimerase GalE [Bacteroidota bacterium]|jgi:UDP-glucose 4-epimerase|nr:UDP-glucose 4-epimerase GalE [Ignavibacteria bacterium]MCU7498916.1 UDP-glucose 4-epimerase GalE [Ignavibacteria bacterium]MCU7513943.1 UDP-glucose 4-epimerase GalE [Ignavibacteria bacterium]MCU7521361.1 UDP-glucose 4-epimerase GalE [Ignavibacteria bacterium]MCU7524193.1 UDP-glucose 4-epimerase GalE [Ignavibacteria bacterium]
MNVLVTGGAGYIGSHVVRMLLKQGHSVVIIDNLSRGHIEAVPEGVKFEEVNLLDYDGLKTAVSRHGIDACIHFAAFAYVGESVENPGLYYVNNVTGSINLIRALNENNIKKIVFSSTCSLYGNPEHVPISEKEKLNPINPYAKTKYFIEQVLSDFDSSFGVKYAALRYFNAAGADFEGIIGESHEPEPHLIPIVLQAALGKREKVMIFGDDYPTEDGTCIRDYIHVYDLADAHIKALEYLNKGNGSTIINLGTGTGYSVKEIIESARRITGREIKAVISARRPGDPAILIADNKKAREVLQWIPEYGLDDIIKSAWQWHQNPKY